MFVPQNLIFFGIRFRSFFHNDFESDFVGCVIAPIKPVTRFPETHFEKFSIATQ